EKLSDLGAVILGGTAFEIVFAPCNLRDCDVARNIFYDGQGYFVPMFRKATLMLKELQQNGKTQASRASLVAEQGFFFRSQRPVLGKFIRVPFPLHSLPL